MSVQYPKAWTAALEAMKQKEQVTDALPIADDDLAQRVLVAWPRISIHVSPPDSMPPVPTNETWRWIWSGVTYDAQELAATAGIHLQMVRIKVDVLKGNHLIYPDGSISIYAAKLLAARMHQQLKQMRT